MAVTFESFGYPDTINPGAAWAKAVTLAGGSRYGVKGAGDWKVTRKAGTDRTVRIAPGTGWGEGIVDTTVAFDELTLGPVAPGVTRYDMVVARRTWGSVNATTFAVIPGSSALTPLPTRNIGPGAVDDQPLAVVPVVSNGGGGILGDPIPLRVWQQNGGAFAQHDLVRWYLGDIGTAVRIGNVHWYLGLDAFENPTWIRSSLNPVPMYSWTGALDGYVGPTTPAGGFLMQAGTQVATSDSAGYSRITFPMAFPNGLLSVQLTNGDENTSNDTTFGVAGNVGGHGTGTRVDVVYRIWGPSNGQRVVLPGKLHRVNWFAIGW